ncbi:hypothetical protein HAX54_039236, partial [Datura stramonium]|nr:hypothetical protein [Datura stramonium]
MSRDCEKGYYESQYGWQHFGMTRTDEPYNGKGQTNKNAQNKRARDKIAARRALREKSLHLSRRWTPMKSMNHEPLRHKP